MIPADDPEDIRLSLSVALVADGFPTEIAVAAIEDARMPGDPRWSGLRDELVAARVRALRKVDDIQDLLRFRARQIADLTRAGDQMAAAIRLSLPDVPIANDIARRALSDAADLWRRAVDGES